MERKMYIFRKYNLIKKIIIPLIMAAVLLAPIGPMFQKNKAEAESVKVGLTFSVEVATKDINNSTNKELSFNVNMEAEDGKTSIQDYRYLYLVLYKLEGTSTPALDAQPYQESYENVPNDSGDTKVTSFKKIFTVTLPKDSKYYYLVVASDGGFDPESHNYQYNMNFIKNEDKLSYTDGYFTVGSSTNQTQVNTISSSSAVKDYGLGCSLIKGLDGIVGCIAGVFYVFWEISAWVARVAGSFLDFLVYYSTNSTSYTNTFVSKGWGAVRDIANIFFIIALLYIAIKIILGIGGHDSKKIISMVILMALLINFSLFFTKVIIDSSNILAKVFYNNITTKDSKTGEKALGNEGEKSISIGLISEYNPQKIIGFEQYENNKARFIFITLLLIAITLYTAYIFFSVALLFAGRVASLWISMIFAPIAFASYTLPFDIPGFGHKEWWKNLFENAFLAPIFIFMLYLIVMFAGMLSEIVKYQSSAGSASEDMLRTVMAVIIPFIILVILLMKAKEMAVKYAGELGQMVNKFGAVAGGVALGAVTGGAAIAGRASLGRMGAAMANSNWANKMARSDNLIARKVGLAARDVGKAAGSGSFDARGIKIAGKNLASTGLKVNTLGGPNTGGYEKMREDKAQKRQRRAEGLEVGKYESKKISQNNAEVHLQKLNNKAHLDIEEADKEIESSRQALTAANAQFGAGSKEAKEAGLTYQNWVNKKKAIREGSVHKEIVGTQKIKKIRKDENGNDLTKKIEVEEEYQEEEKIPYGGTRTVTKKRMVEKEVPDEYEEEEKIYGKSEDFGAKYGGSIKEAEKALREAKHHVAEENQKRRERYAKDIESTSSKIFNTITSLGQYSSLGANEAAYRVRMDMKAPPKAPKGGGSDHQAPSHGGGGGHKEDHGKKENHGHKEDHGKGGGGAKDAHGH